MRVFIRAIRLLNHLCIGLFMITFVLPNKNNSDKAQVINSWSKQLARIFNISVVVHGKPPSLAPQNQMFLSNHISWFDIFALYTVFNSRFIAKSDIQSWPVINKLCTGAGTFFIQREKIKDTKRVSDSITTALKNGDSVTFFPEGTTTDGTYLKPMKTSLIQSIVDSQGRIQPIYLNYRERNGKHSAAAAYIDDITMAQSLHTLLSSDGIEVHLHFLASIDASQHDRSSISSAIKASLHEAHVNFHQYSDMHALPEH